MALGGCRPVRLIEYLQCGFVQMPADRFTQLLVENLSKDFQSLVELNGIMTECGIADVDTFTLQYFVFPVER